MELESKRYQKIRKLGEGSFGRVFLAVENSPSDPQTQSEENEGKSSSAKSSSGRAQRFIAIKKLKNLRSKSEESKEIREIELHKMIKHPNIIQLIEVLHEKDAVNMVLEYMSTDLSELLKNYFENLTPEDKLYIMWQTTNAVEYLHTSGIIHRDLKPSNVLINSEGDVKLSDFSISKKLEKEKSFGPMTKNVVTRYYRPAEIIYGCQNYGTEIDIWSLGCLFAELFYGKPLFPGETDIDQLNKIFEAIGSPSVEDWPECVNLPYFLPFEFDDPPPGLSKFVGNNELLLDLLNKMMALNPGKRINIKDVRSHPFFASAAKIGKGDCTFVKYVYEDSLHKTVRFMEEKREK